MVDVWEKNNERVLFWNANVIFQGPVPDKTQTLQVDVRASLVPFAMKLYVEGYPQFWMKGRA